MHVGRAPSAGWSELRSPRPSSKDSGGEGHGASHDDRSDQIDETAPSKIIVGEADPGYPRTATEGTDGVELIGFIGFVDFVLFIFLKDPSDYFNEFHRSNSISRHRHGERRAHGGNEKTS